MAPERRTYSRRSQLEAAKLIVDPATAKGWGWRLIRIGASGSGKSYFGNVMHNYAQDAGSASMIWIYDFKDPTVSWQGIVRSSIADLKSRPPKAGDSRTIIFHSGELDGDPESVAAAAFDEPDHLVLDIDEVFPDCVTESGRAWKAGETGSIALLLRKGRTRQKSVMLGSQMAQNMPPIAMSLCDHRAIFRCDAGSLDYLEEGKRIPKGSRDIVQRLEPGEFLLMVNGEWDGVISGPK